MKGFKKDQLLSKKLDNKIINRRQYTDSLGKISCTPHLFGVILRK